MATANRFWHNLRRIAKHKYVPHIKKYATKFQTKKGPYIYIYIYIYEKKTKTKWLATYITRLEQTGVTRTNK